MQATKGHAASRDYTTIIIPHRVHCLSLLLMGLLLKVTSHHRSRVSSRTNVPLKSIASGQVRCANALTTTINVDVACRLSLGILCLSVAALA